jgi:FKBP-type peptidyl-prolyl cis-trans isomerase
MSRSALFYAVVSIVALAAGGCLPGPADGTGELVDLTPEAAAGIAGEQAQAGEIVTLAAELPADVDATGLTYCWFQTYGRLVTIIDPNFPEASFVAPSLPKAQTLSFRVDVIAPDGTIYNDTVEVAVAGDDNYDADGSADDAEEDDVIADLRAQIAKSKSVLAQEFADLVQFGMDADGNKLRQTASGLKYVVLKAGDGDKPAPSDRVRVHYAGWLFDDGTLFDNSIERGRPASFALQSVIDGWAEGLGLMREGSYYRLVIPSDLAYGETGYAPDIPPDATLVFNVYLINIALDSGTIR